MKTCPYCAEQIQDEARLCRYCGKKQKKPLSRLENAARIAAGSALLLLLFAYLSAIRDGDLSKKLDNMGIPHEPLKAADHQPVNDPAKCDELIQRAGRSGLVRERPSSGRINVDDVRWALLPATEKSTLLQAVFCSTFGGRSATRGGTFDYVVAYGYRSGKRLAMMSSSGLSLE